MNELIVHGTATTNEANIVLGNVHFRIFRYQIAIFTDPSCIENVCLIKRPRTSNIYVVSSPCNALPEKSAEIPVSIHFASFFREIRVGA